MQPYSSSTPLLQSSSRLMYGDHDIKKSAPFLTSLAQQVAMNLASESDDYHEFTTFWQKASPRTQERFLTIFCCIATKDQCIQFANKFASYLKTVTIYKHTNSTHNNAVQTLLEHANQIEKVMFKTGSENIYLSHLTTPSFTANLKEVHIQSEIGLIALEILLKLPKLTTLAVSVRLPESITAENFDSPFKSARNCPLEQLTIKFNECVSNLMGIENFDHIKSLAIQNILIDQTNSEKLASLTTLTTLTFRNTTFSAGQLSRFKSLRNLEGCSIVSGCKVDLREVIDFFKTMPSISQIGIETASNEVLSSDQCASIINCRTKLTSFFCKHPIQGDIKPILVALINHPELRKVSLVLPELSQEHLEQLFSLTQIEKLHIETAKSSAVSYAARNALRALNLTSVRLVQPTENSDLINALQNMRNLTMLDLEMPITDLDAQNISQIRSLTHFFYKNPLKDRTAALLSDEGFVSIANMPNIEEILISGRTNLTRKAVEETLKRAPHIFSCSVSDTGRSPLSSLFSSLCLGQKKETCCVKNIEIAI